jgi:hypothetical protein
MTENHLTEVHFTEESLMEQIFSPTNLNRAYKQVVGNRGVGGVDKMATQDLLPGLQLHKEELLNTLYSGTYRPNPVRRVEIPKENGKSATQRKASLVKYIRGWVEYFKLADMKCLLQATDSWLRRRLRMCIWKSWKQAKTHLRNLIRCGVAKSRASEASYTRRSYWCMSKHPVVHEAISIKNLRRAGYPFLSDYYRKVAS